MARDYSKSKIYAIKNIIDDEVYVGSTLQTLSFRMTKHKTKAKQTPDRPLYQKMNEYGFEKFYIELICEFPCCTKQELLAKEGEYIRQLGTLNKQIAGRSREEYYIENRESTLTQKKQYQAANRDKILQYQKQYYTENRENKLEYHKQHYKINREKKLEQQKKYYESNKDHINAKNKEQIQCELCGTSVSRIHIARHQKSIKCINNRPESEASS